MSAAGFIGSVTILAEYGLEEIDKLSQLTSVITGFYYLGLAIYPFVRFRLDGPAPFFRASIVTLGLITGGVFNTLMAGSLDSTGSLFEHAVVPLMLLLDWCLFGRNQERMKPWHALALPAFPLVYLIVALAIGANSEPLYNFLDPSSSGFAAFIAIMLGAVVVLGFILLLIGRVQRSIRAQSAAPRGVYAGNSQPQRLP